MAATHHVPEHVRSCAPCSLPPHRPAFPTLFIEGKQRHLAARMRLIPGHHSGPCLVFLKKKLRRIWTRVWESGGASEAEKGLAVMALNEHVPGLVPIV
ncbi:hypothetical protein C0Q70_04097 [Pomacea canaliculata]|uniref:Uncharacterized protein n=1 Tax=Pomacea canaliculata TaxID=400727 RepID=A0A2T7PUK4_POMCA|nr:hypothetical protein C0Q70_04097 [Pomacea canaliculata]